MNVKVAEFNPASSGKFYFPNFKFLKMIKCQKKTFALLL